MSLLRSRSGSTQAPPDGASDRNIPRSAGLQTRSRRLAVDLVVNVRVTGATAVLIAPLLFAPALGGASPAMTVAGLLPWLHGSYLRLGARARL
ncbi:hypothetical protein ACPC54_37250 [Kitasatospora sp. NPDC094028]